MKKILLPAIFAFFAFIGYSQLSISKAESNIVNNRLIEEFLTDVEVNYVVVAPEIDDIIEEIWNDVTPVPISNIILTANFSELNAQDINCYEIISPLNAATNIPLKTTVKINFCVDSLLAGADGSITISDQLAVRVLGVNYFIYNIKPEMISGNSLSFLAAGLQENKLYSIYIPYGAVADSKGNPFAGITDPTSWSFTTGDFTYPIVSVDSRYVFSFDGIANPIAITSSEAGTVYLARSDIPANSEALFAAITQGKAVSATLAVAGTVTIDAEGLQVGIYNAYAIDVSGRIGVASNVVTVYYYLMPNPYRMIRQIQGETTESPLVGNKVRTMGIVTAITNSGFFMQDENKPWSGIFVNTTGSVTVGSTVDIIGTVSEDKGLTTIGNVEGIIFTPPILLATSITIGSEVALSEKYESVLVNVTGRATTGGIVSSDWTIVSANGINYKINNLISGTYNIKKDYEYSVTGIVIQSDTAYQVLATYIVQSIIPGKFDLSNSIEVFPNPFDNFITFNVSNGIKIKKAVITNITGQLVKEVIDPDNKIATGELYKGVYFISLQTPNGIIKTERLIKR